MSYSRVIVTLTVFVLLLAVCISEPLQEASDEVNSIATNKRPFFVGSRYGRSAAYATKSRVNVAPRNDRFFLGSRYGKRANEFLPLDIEQEVPSSQSSYVFTMQCAYSGFRNYFKCSPVKSSNNNNNLIQNFLSQDESTE